MIIALLGLDAIILEATAIALLVTRSTNEVAAPAEVTARAVGSYLLDDDAPTIILPTRIITPGNLSRSERDRRIAYWAAQAWAVVDERSPLWGVRTIDRAWPHLMPGWQDDGWLATLAGPAS